MGKKSLFILPFLPFLFHFISADMLTTLTFISAGLQCLRFLSSLLVLQPSRKKRLKPYLPFSLRTILSRVWEYKASSSTANAGQLMQGRRAESVFQKTRALALETDIERLTAPLLNLPSIRKYRGNPGLSDHSLPENGLFFYISLCNFNNTLVRLMRRL